MRQPTNSRYTHDEYEVSSILGRRAVNNQVEYLIKWKPTWEPEALLSCSVRKQDFEQRQRECDQRQREYAQRRQNKTYRAIPSLKRVCLGRSDNTPLYEPKQEQDGANPEIGSHLVVAPKNDANLDNAEDASKVEAPREEARYEDAHPREATLQVFQQMRALLVDENSSLTTSSETEEIYSDICRICNSQPFYQRS